jgi:hypothetical protein
LLWRLRIWIRWVIAANSGKAPTKKMKMKV